VNSFYPVRSLSDIADRIDYGLTASATDKPVGPKFLRITDIAPERLDWSTVPFCRVASDDERQKYALAPGDIVIARTGATVGYSKCIVHDIDAVFASYLVRVRIGRDCDPHYVGYVVGSDDYKDFIKSNAGGAAQPNANARVLTSYLVPVPPLLTQRKIASILSAYDELIENNNQRIKILEEMAQRIYREWFVDFRYPGRGDVPLMDSELGPIPLGWAVRTIAEVAAPQRYAVTSGPFGSKLGGKDYVTAGVPVIRGTNLAVGGNFRDSDFVFVSNEKADSMKSCLARSGDVVVTQRGTLGQVGLIPEQARFERYVLSQSQMKITVDPSQGSNQYFYAAMRSPEVTRRLQDHAMAAGVPHINLSILREFPVVWPDVGVQSEAAQTFRLLGHQVFVLEKAVECARATRDLLLPRLVSGEVDIADLDIAIPEVAA
jgi:type I restriction enzyme, S subunit